MNLGGYYHAEKQLLDAAMRPSPTFNQIIAQIQ